MITDMDKVFFRTRVKFLGVKYCLMDFIILVIAWGSLTLLNLWIVMAWLFLVSTITTYISISVDREIDEESS